MLLCMEADKQCEVSLLSAIHMLTYVWKNTSPEVVANCFRYSGFVHDAADPDVDDVPLCNYTAIDNDVAVAGKVTDRNIVADVLDAEGQSTDEEPSDSYERPRHKLKEAAHVLTVLEDICTVSSDSVC